MSIDVKEKYYLLRKYSHYLKTELKAFTGKKVTKGSSVENKLRVYRKLRKLIHYVDDELKGKVEQEKKIIKQVDNYYEYLESKISKSLNGQTELSTSTRGKTKQVSHHEQPPGNKQVNQESIETDEDDEEITEVGPTPQLNGRVLTIFDIQPSPEKIEMSPMKGVPKLNLGIQLEAPQEVEMFKTPTKPVKTLDLGFGSSSRKLTFDKIDIADDDLVKDTVPAKSNMQPIHETPKYLKTQSTKLNHVDYVMIDDNWSEDEFDDGFTDTMAPLGRGNDDKHENDTPKKHFLELSFSDSELSTLSYIEPSPIIKRTSGRSLFELHKDVVNLKRNLTDLQELAGLESDHNELNKQDEPVLQTVGYDEYKLDEKPKESDEADQNLVSGESTHVSSPTKDNTLFRENIVNVFDPHYKLRNKIKTIKRSTRRAKLQSDKISIHDDLEEIDIHALAFGKRKLNFDEGQSCDSAKDHSKSETPHKRSSDIYTSDEDDELYERKDIAQLEKELEVKNKGKGFKGKHPLSNNFVRLKINRGRRGNSRFKRRR